MAANLLAKQAEMGDFQMTERTRWTQNLIHKAFSDPLDAAALSRRFSRHGDNRLDLAVWSAISMIDVDALSRRPHFKKISMEVMDQLPGVAEFLMSGIKAC